MRSNVDDIALRGMANEFISAANDNRAEAATQLLKSMWDQYFSGGRMQPSDVDILEAMMFIGFRNCPETLHHDYQMEYARIRNQPVLYTEHESKLNEDSRFLLAFKNNVTSQEGEDGIIKKVFEIIGTQNKWCVEFGAFDGLENCNSHTLVMNEGWNGIFIEGNNERYASLEKNYEGVEKAHVFNAFIGYGPVFTPLEDVLASRNVPADFDFLSIDIDGNDWHVWKKITGYRPRVLMIEFNPTIANDIVFIQQDDHTIMCGNSLRAFIMLGREKGYELVCATSFNAIFVIREEYDKFGIPDNSIDAMYEPLMDGRVFHGYSGSIFNVGMPRLLWSIDNLISDADFIENDEIRLVRK